MPQTKLIFYFLLCTCITAVIYNQVENIRIFISLGIIVSLGYFMLKIRHDFCFFPLFLITKIQKRKFKVLKDLNEITKILKLSDKGQVIEELFASPSFLPILSLESTNGKIWETLKKNLFKFVAYIPSQEKLASIAKQESNNLLKNKIVLDSKLVSKMTVKIFLKWLFMDQVKIDDNNTDSSSTNKESTQIDSINSDDEVINNDGDEFVFINKFLTEEFLDNMYESSLEYRKEIAIKGKGCMKKKQYAVDAIVEIFKQSKYSDLFDWEKPECYSIIMQPFIISPMINMSDIAVILDNNKDKYNKKEFESFNSYLDFCLFKEHPFPILERYDAEINTQYFIDMRNLKNHINEKEGSVVNFGVGIRGCMGRAYARKFITSFFGPFINEKELFLPKVGHLYSGRDNDNASIVESIYQFKVLFKVLKDEVIRNYF